MDMAVLEFRDHVLRHTDVPTRVADMLMQMVARARGGETVDSSLMRGSLNMLVRMGVYDSVFEGRFLEETDAFYRAESADVLASSTCSDYLHKAEARIAEERSRVQDYLTDATGQRLRAVVERRLIADHTTTIVEMESGAISMMDGARTDELASMYRLFAMVRTTTPYPVAVRVAGKESGAFVTKEMTPMGILRDRFQRHIETNGRALVTDTEEAKNPVRFVERLLAMHAHFLAIAEGSFDSDRQFLRSMKEAFEFFVNVDGRCAQFLSLVSRRGSKAASASPALWPEAPGHQFHPPRSPPCLRSSSTPSSARASRPRRPRRSTTPCPPSSPPSASSRTRTCSRPFTSSTSSAASSPAAPSTTTPSGP